MATPGRLRQGYGRDEIGNPTMMGLLGREYAFQYPTQQQPQMPRITTTTTLDALGRATHNAVESAPRQPNMVAGLLQALGEGITAPGRALSGEAMTIGDALNTAGFAQLGAAAMPAPAGALRSGAMRSGKTEAQKVADLLKSGRASEVTDDMMARVDPQEMWRLYESGATGMDMPMDEASRMARADARLPADAYHSTGATFDEFVPSQVGRHGAGVYTGKNVADVESFLPRDDVSKRFEFESGAQTIPLRIPGDSAFANEMRWQDALPDRWAYGDPKDTADAISGYAEGADSLSRAGFSGVTQPATDWDGRVVFDPTNIRSRFARFDPRLSHLANLSAGIGGLLFAAGMAPRQAQAGGLLSMGAQ